MSEPDPNRQARPVTRSMSSKPIAPPMTDFEEPRNDQEVYLPTSQHAGFLTLSNQAAPLGWDGAPYLPMSEPNIQLQTTIEASAPPGSRLDTINEGSQDPQALQGRGDASAPLPQQRGQNNKGNAQNTKRKWAASAASKRKRQTSDDGSPHPQDDGDASAPVKRRRGEVADNETQDALQSSAASAAAKRKRGNDDGDGSQPSKRKRGDGGNGDNAQPDNDEDEDEPRRKKPQKPRGKTPNPGGGRKEPEFKACNFCTNTSAGRLMATSRPCDWYKVGKYTIECTNCADHRLANPGLGHVCKISRRRDIWRRYATHDRVDYDPAACDSCIAGGRGASCDVDTTLGLSCGKCLKTDCFVNGAKMKKRPNLRQGFERWFRHACDACHSRTANVGEPGCSWLRDRTSWTRRCTRCEGRSMTCWNGGVVVAHPPEPNVPAVWSVSHTLDGGWAELRGGSPWRKNCLNCAANGNHCRAMSNAAMTACNRCFQLGIDCVDAQGNNYPLPDLSRVGLGNFMPFRACGRCVAQKRNCDRQRPCDSCVDNGGAHLCDAFKGGDSCHNGRLDPRPGPLYYLALGYGAGGVDDPRDGSRLEHWIGPGFPIYSMEAGDTNSNKMAIVAIAEGMARAVRPSGMPPHGHRGGALENTRASQLLVQDLVQMIRNNWAEAEVPGRYDKYLEAVDIARARRALLATSPGSSRRPSRRGTTRTPGPAAGGNDADAPQVNLDPSDDDEAPKEEGRRGGGRVEEDEANDSDATETDSDAPGSGDGIDDGDDDDDADDGNGGGVQGGGQGRGGSDDRARHERRDGTAGLGDPVNAPFGQANAFVDPENAPVDLANVAANPANALAADIINTLIDSEIDPELLVTILGPPGPDQERQLEEWMQQVRHLQHHQQPPQPQTPQQLPQLQQQLQQLQYLQQSPVNSANPAQEGANEQQGASGEPSNGNDQSFDYTEFLNLSPESLKSRDGDGNQDPPRTPETPVRSLHPANTLLGHDPDLELGINLGQVDAGWLFQQGRPIAGINAPAVGSPPHPASVSSLDEEALLREQTARNSRDWTPPPNALDTAGSQFSLGGTVNPSDIYQSPESRRRRAAEEAQNSDSAAEEARRATPSLQSTRNASDTTSVAAQQSEDHSGALNPQAPAIESSAQGTGGRFGRWNEYTSPENLERQNNAHGQSMAGSSHQGRVSLFEDSHPSVRQRNEVRVRNDLRRVRLSALPAIPIGGPADGPRRCDEPSPEGNDKCGHPIRYDQMCASLDHPGPSGRGWGVCDPCAQESADVVVGVKPGGRRVEPHELLSMRAYFCNGCAVSYGRSIGSLRPLLRHGARTIWGSSFSEGFEVQGSLAVNDSPIHFYKDALPATGCACATKLFGQRLCREHRCFYVEKALAGVAAVRQWRHENLGGDLCAGCLLTMSPGDANVGSDGQPGAYGQPVAWICMQCNDAVVNQTGPGLVPGWESWFSRAPLGWAAASNRARGGEV